ncbi:MAG: glycosyltransferase [Roseburia sp.]|nr:glycosyltransferase [Roseburia sp.]MCM1201647.1 glycosyltransferase [Bacteroides fragilis]
MKEAVKVSIITVVYNGIATIEQTIKSVINQNYSNIEYIIIDGASTDGTRELIRKYADYIDVFISEADEGLYYAMNKGIKSASGEIIGILNSDDLYVDTAVYQVVDYYNKYNVDILYGDAMWFGGSEQEELYSCTNLEDLWYRMAIPHPATFVKKEIYEKYGSFNTKYHISADYDLMLRMYSRNLKFGHINEILTYFRRGGVSLKKQKESLKEGMEISLHYIQRCNDKDRWLPKIYEYNILGRFSLILSEDIVIEKFKKIICGETNNKTVIFGTGKWSERCIDILLQADVCIDFVVDNNKTKWGEKFHGVIVKSPSELCNYEGVILIATYKYEKEIRQQLKGINEQLAVFSILNWAEAAVM